MKHRPTQIEIVTVIPTYVMAHQSVARSDLALINISVLSCKPTPTKLGVSPITCCCFRLRNDLYCVEWGVKLYSLTITCWWRYPSL